MTIFTVLFLVVLGPLLKRLIRLAGFVLVFPLALVVLVVKTILVPRNHKHQVVRP